MASQVRKALESTESLLASLLNREQSSTLSLPIETTSDATDSGNKRDSLVDVEQSLLGTGEAIVTSNSSAQEAVPSPLNITSPVHTLSSLVNRSLITAGDDYSNDPTYLQEQLYQAEKDLQLSAKVGLALSNRVNFLEKEVTRLTVQLTNSNHTLEQARHELMKKDSLLKLYYIHEEENDLQREDSSQEPPEWVQALSKENSQLKADNRELREDNIRLQNEVQCTGDREKALVKQCFEQLSEAKQQLQEFQTEMERQENECHQLQTKLDICYQNNEALTETKEELIEEIEEMKRQMSEAEANLTQLSVEIFEWQEKYDAIYTLMKDAQEENKMLKELSGNSSTSVHLNGGTNTPSEGEHHESIVQEIEDVLRRELIAASTLTDRPVSPNNYAQQRTMVVMETVKAATLATARKLEKLATDQRKKEEDLAQQQQSITFPLDGATPEDISKIRQQYPSYFSPQKLQIVKPMEGSVTLLRWKLLATPQLRGPSALMSANDRPGIHIKDYSSNSRPGSSLKIDTERRWHSVCDLSSYPPVNTTANITPVTSHTKHTAPTNQQQSQLSTVNRLKQNFWGLISSSGRAKKPQEKQDDSQGLQELLGP